jgi:hypothetical protein
VRGAKGWVEPYCKFVWFPNQPWIDEILLPPISFDNSETFQSLGLEVWGEPSKAAEMFQSSSSLFAENGIGPKLVFSRLSRGYRRRSHYEQSDRDIEERDWILKMMGFGLGPRLI